MTVINFGKRGVSSSAKGIADPLMNITGPASWWLENGNIVILQEVQSNGGTVLQSVVIPKDKRLYLALDILESEAKHANG